MNFGMIRNVEHDIRYQLREYFFRRSTEWFGDRDKIPTDIVVDACVELNRYFMNELERYHQCEYERIKYDINPLRTARWDYDAVPKRTP